MLTIKTLNSTYEVDTDAKRVRRISGENEIMRSLGRDGDWRDYAGAYGLEVGDVARFLFNNSEGLITSTIESIIDDTAERLGRKPIIDFGLIAYEGYCDSSGGVSLVSGESLPSWNALGLVMRCAWRIAATAVLNKAGEVLQIDLTEPLAPFNAEITLKRRA